MGSIDRRDSLLKLQAFGPKEKNFTEEEKEKIIEILKYSNYATLPIRRMVFDAESQTAHYFQLAKIAGVAVSAGVYAWFPVIRRQPVVRRAFFAALPGYFVYDWTTSYGNNLKWTKCYYAWQKLIISMGGHPHVLI